jgi:hypothetical protein
MSSPTLTTTAAGDVSAIATEGVGTLSRGGEDWRVGFVGDTDEALLPVVGEAEEVVISTFEGSTSIGGWLTDVRAGDTKSTNLSVSSFSSTVIITGSPTLTSVPASTNNFAIYTASTASNPLGQIKHFYHHIHKIFTTVALSVSISAIVSPAFTSSPGCFNHATIVPPSLLTTVRYITLFHPNNNTSLGSKQAFQQSHVVVTVMQEVVGYICHYV